MMKIVESKPQHSNTVYRTSRLSKCRRLESRAKLLEQVSRMAIQRKKRKNLSSNAKTIGNEDGNETRSNASRISPDTMPIQQVVLFQWTVQTLMSQLTSKMTEIAGEPLEWLEWSSLLNAVMRNAPIDVIAKRSYLKTLLKAAKLRPLMQVWVTLGHFRTLPGTR